MASISNDPRILRHPVTGRPWSFPISLWREVFTELEADNKRNEGEQYEAAEWAAA
jgi:hypothetical protein